MKKMNETRPEGTTTAKKEAESRDNKQYCFLNRLNVSETERGVLARMNRCTPDNELKIRGFQ